jgi:PAS domain S-box-containing protein
MISVLFVDDEQDQLSLAKIFLERSDTIRVDTALSGSGAIEKIREKKYNAVVSDYLMPEIDGIALLKYIRQVSPSTPFILVTARGDLNVVIEALNSGADFYIIKTSDPKVFFTDLESKIELALQKRMDECKLAESEKNYRMLIEMARHGIWMIDAGANTIFVNPQMAEMLGYSVGEMIGKPVYSFIDGPAVNTIKENIERRKQGIRDTYTLGVIRKDGKTIYMRISAIPLTDGKGNYTGSLGILTDITESREYDNKLHERTGELNRFFEIALDLLCIADMDGNFRRLNRSWETTLGYPLEELEGKQFLSFVHPDDLHQTLEAIKDLSKGKEILNFVNRYRCRDGSYRWIEWRSTPYGNLIYAAARDITDRKRYTDTLDQVNRKLNLLGSVTRHDIMNKLMVLLGYQQLMMDTLTDPGALNMLKKQQQATTDIQHQIEFTREYQDLGAEAPGWQNVHELVIRTVPYFDLTHISFNESVSGLQLYADPLLEKVFYNLFDNSIRHGKQITEINVSFLLKPDELVLIWSDNGAGIPYREKKKIFDPGFGKNTGLGLFLVREILSITGMTILENGEPGKGARFEIHVPKDMFRINPET